MYILFSMVPTEVRHHTLVHGKVFFSVYQELSTRVEVAEYRPDFVVRVVCDHCIITEVEIMKNILKRFPPNVLGNK